ncbi:MAG: YCF48-related protein, partial [Ignavibacteria bacterium]|nr:YCF48-related protein [Ignavibacteria bacterium]
MKTRLTLLLTICFTMLLNAQWTWQNPLPQGNSLSSIHFADANLGWILGGGGTILKTTNGGENWMSQSSGTARSLRSVDFIDTKTGWAVGGLGTILKTSDGGTHWISQSSGTRNNLTSVDFVDANTGWAVSESGI